jgi:hypothetical protein
VPFTTRHLHALAALAIVLAALSGASSAAAATRMSPADRNAISTLMDRFIKDAVLRENLAEGWTLAGPDLRGGTTRAAWISGKGVTVAAFPARGTNFRNAWTGHLVAPGHFEGSVILQPKAGSAFDQTAVTVDAKRISGRWVVDAFYSAAVFRSGSQNRGSCGRSNCAISGPADYGPQGAASAAGNTSARVSGHTFLTVLAAIGILLLATPFVIWARIRRRDRRARAAYEAHNQASR